MFGRQALLDALQQIGNNLEKDIAIYLIGGCAMTFMGQKVSTKDIDVVFSSLKDLELFIEAAKKSGFFALKDLAEEYKTLGTWIVIRNLDGMRFDLFNRIVCNALEINDRVMSRARKFLRFGRLDVLLTSPEDIFLFKGMTERKGDLDDMRVLAEGGLQWSIVKEECMKQEKRRIWETFLADRLIELKKTYGIDSPIIRELIASADTELIKNLFRRTVQAGNDTFDKIAASIKEKYGYSEHWTRKELSKVVKARALKVKKRGRRNFYSI